MTHGLPHHIFTTGKVIHTMSHHHIIHTMSHHHIFTTGKVASRSLALARSLPTTPRTPRRVSARERVVWAGVAAGVGGGGWGCGVHGAMSSSYIRDASSQQSSAGAAASHSTHACVASLGAGRLEAGGEGAGEGGAWEAKGLLGVKQTVVREALGTCSKTLVQLVVPRDGAQKVVHVSLFSDLCVIVCHCYRILSLVI